MYRVPGSAVVSVNVVPVIAGEAGVMSVVTAPTLTYPRARKILYRGAPVGGLPHVNVTPEALVPLVAAMELTAVRARYPVSLVLASLSRTPAAPTALTA